MNTIIPFKGKVKYPVTMDAGVWIFDDRRIDLN
ncbi:peptidyl-prolyl cis-trans isomerase, partial [Geobacillus sp. NFOSA3]|nr:peptidyl-prolyl cis-trans isomerase [Geobacillus sp. NFOSA3]